MEEAEAPYGEDMYIEVLKSYYAMLLTYIKSGMLKIMYVLAYLFSAYRKVFMRYYGTMCLAPRLGEFHELVSRFDLTDWIVFHRK